MLLLGLQERYTMWDEEQKISDIFLSIVPFFKMYVQYMANYSGAIEALPQFRKQYPEFSKFLEKVQGLPRFKSHQLLSLMILPIQRIPRYILLLDQLVHYTDPSHPDYDGLTLCLSEVKKIADQINESLREFEQQKKVYEIHSKLTNRPTNLGPLVSPSRWFVNSFDVHKPGNQGSKRHLILFNDIALLCKKISDDRFDYKDEMKLHSRCWVQPLNDHPNEFLFHVVGPEKSWSLMAYSFEDQQRIYKQLESAIQGKTIKRSSLQRLSVHTTGVGSYSGSSSTNSLTSPITTLQKRRSTPASTGNLLPPPRRDSIRVSLQPPSSSN
ncbi:hypothetical protein HMI54_009751 [Coelomomyces lativittatus]|nr:hypothetical protein HMI54_009751 [Coelomomyces lativittatus]